jgi:hypothetical protein
MEGLVSVAITALGKSICDKISKGITEAQERLVDLIVSSTFLKKYARCMGLIQAALEIVG